MLMLQHASTQVDVTLQRGAHDGRSQALDRTAQLLPATVKRWTAAKLEMQEHARIAMSVE